MGQSHVEKAYVIPRACFYCRPLTTTQPNEDVYKTSTPSKTQDISKNTRSRFRTPAQKSLSFTMASNTNPWQDEYSSSTPHGSGGYQSPPPAQAHGVSNHNPYSAYQDQTSHNQYAPPDHPPPGHNLGQGQFGYQSSTHNDADPWAQYQSPDFNPNPQQPPSNPSNPSHGHQFRVPPINSETQNYQGLNDNNYEVPPGLPPRRTGTDLALPQGQDRSHQIEVMQSYEARGRKDEHDQNVEILQREFPKLDGALIAAIYGDSQSLSATREMLGELDRE